MDKIVIGRFNDMLVMVKDDRNEKDHWTWVEKVRNLSVIEDFQNLE